MRKLDDDIKNLLAEIDRPVWGFYMGSFLPRKRHFWTSLANSTHTTGSIKEMVGTLIEAEIERRQDA